MTAVAFEGARPAESAKHTLAASILLHLYPGAAMVAVYLLVAPIGLRHGLPPLLMSCAVFLLVLAPLEAGHLMWLGRKTTGAWSLGGALIFPKPMPLWRYALIVPGVIVATIVAYALIQPANLWFAHNVMGFLPSWYDFSSIGQYRGFGPGVLMATLVLRFLADIVVMPAVEELYFRGYLMSRIPGPAWLAPIASTVLFAVYHFWQPYNWVAIAVFSLPMILAAWWWKDTRISIASHVTMNLIGFLTFAAAVLHR